ncbi:alpha/beta hydrolase [Oceanicoccus sagamiensis]|uniref:Alpha/beta hydrolase fold-5 domain-containing protein n=1 Tax=Oceanicoccus sagamiensis TaxID=716816 RepID=A0A1X9N8L7_9GAMM|nr:alpha/beta hydrolase [Oceanicoccus sagamiensis]ARN74400.1 hypothetical protein BST96_09850 [Oceanicoccus sagamiensis]
MSVAKRLLKLLLGIVLIAIAVQLAWYQIDGQPTAEADQYLQGDLFSSAQQDNGDWLFTPHQPNGYGLLILHGALIKPKSYSYTAAYFASRGYKVWIPSGVIRLSALSSERIAQQLPQMGNEQWFLLGHSMGGLTALTVANQLSQAPLGVTVWAGGIPQDFSHIPLPILFISGTNDPMLSPEKFKTAKQHLPLSTVYFEINGANHKNFALYSHQFFDGIASIEHLEQINLAHQRTEQFIQQILALK